MRKIPAATLLASVLALVTVFSFSPSRALTLLTEENPPLNYTEKGKLTGMATEVVAEMAKRAGMTREHRSTGMESRIQARSVRS